MKFLRKKNSPANNCFKILLFMPFVKPKNDYENFDNTKSKKDA